MVSVILERPFSCHYHINCCVSCVEDMAGGPVAVCCNLNTYASVGIDRFRWPRSVKERQVAVVRPVMKTTTTTTDSISSTSSVSPSAAAATAVNLSSQPGLVSASVRSNDSQPLNSRSNTSRNSQSIASNRLSVIGNPSSTSASSSSSLSSSSLPAPAASSSTALSSQFPDSVSSIPIGWEHTWSFYYPDLTMSEAKQLLKPHSEGTFLLRNSSEPRYAYSLSVKTNRGTTSVRIQRMESGRYRLDCDPTQETVIPTFRSVPELIRHYLERNEEERNVTGCGRGHRYVFLESTGRMDTPVLILRPLVKDSPLDRRSTAS